VDSSGQKINITLGDGQIVSCFVGTQVKNIIKKFKLPKTELTYLGALVNNEMVSLTYPLEVDSNVKFLTFLDSWGWKIYQSSLTFLLSKAAHDCFPELNLEMRHTVGNGLYCTFDDLPAKMEFSDVIEVLKSHIQKLVDAKLPIIRRKLYLKNAVRYFGKMRRTDKTKLLHFMNDTKIVIYQCESFFDLAYENVLCNNTEDLKYFKIYLYDERGFVLQFPERKIPVTIAEFKPLPHIFSVFKHYKRWGDTIGIRTVADLNEVIVRGNLRRLIRIEEAYQEKRIAEIADRIKNLIGKLKWVLISGPSSSGKTTFAHRLGTQMRVNGITPVVISVDNYFRDRNDTPLDGNGDFDFENIDAIDLKLLNEHLTLLDQGKEIELPFFDFKAGIRKWSGRRLALGENEVAVIEGIHSLNPKMTKSLSADHKFRIYINALTQLNLDENHRVSTTDNRLIRRIVRDHRTRGNRALATLEMWPSVRRGEKKWIFKFQEKADYVFSSALNYELSVLKLYVEPLLAEVKPWDKQYVVARRLQNFLKIFVSTDKEYIPHNSLIREFVGGGILEE
jgi:uridine kinase